MLTALTLALLSQTGTMTLTVSIPVTVASRAECRLYSDSRKQWLDLTKTPPVWVNTIAGDKTGGLLVADVVNPDIRSIVVPALEPGVYRFYTRLLITNITNGIPADLPTKDPYSSAVLSVEATTPPPVVTVTVTQPK